jgi:hypothetical protein
MKLQLLSLVLYGFMLLQMNTQSSILSELGGWMFNMGCNMKYWKRKYIIVRTKGVIRSRDWRTDSTMAKTKGQKSTKHYTENWRSSNTNPTKNRGWIRMFRKGHKFLLHKWDTSIANWLYIVLNFRYMWQLTNNQNLKVHSPFKQTLTHLHIALCISARLRHGIYELQFRGLCHLKASRY